MISMEEIKRISKMVDTQYDGLVIDGEYKYNNQEAEIPSLEEIISEAIEGINLAVSSVKRVSPYKANCIIRVYKHEHLKANGDIHWIWGIRTYFKTFKEYISLDNFKINYEEHLITKYLFQDESVILRPDFVDIYLKIS